MQNTFRRFEADCDQVNVPDGTLLEVTVNGKYVGAFPSLDQGGALVLTGRRAPNVTKGTTVSIGIHNGPTIPFGHYNVEIVSSSNGERLHFLTSSDTTGRVMCAS